jgi:hypothetical protein
VPGFIPPLDALAMKHVFTCGFEGFPLGERFIAYGAIHASRPLLFCGQVTGARGGDVHTTLILKILKKVFKILFLK